MRSAHLRQWSSTIALCAALAACGGGPLTFTVHGTELAPGADAVIRADRDPGSFLTRLHIEAAHVPPPSRIAEGGSSFVVWARADRYTSWERVGALVYDSDDRKGSLDATVPRLSFDLQITVEQEPVPPSPSGQVLLRQTIAK